MINSLSKRSRVKRAFAGFWTLNYIFFRRYALIYQRTQANICTQMTDYSKPIKSYVCFFSAQTIWHPNQYVQSNAINSKWNNLSSLFIVIVSPSLSRVRSLALFIWFLIYHRAQKCTNLCICLYCMVYLGIILHCKFILSLDTFIKTKLSLLKTLFAVVVGHVVAVVVVIGIVHFRYVTPELIEFLVSCVLLAFFLSSSVCYMHIQKFAIIKRKAR